MEVTCVSINRWTNKEDVAYMYNGILWKQKIKFAISKNMGGLEGHDAKWNRSHRERQIMYSITYMCNLKNTKN